MSVKPTTQTAAHLNLLNRRWERLTSTAQRGPMSRRREALRIGAEAHQVIAAGTDLVCSWRSASTYRTDSPS